MLNKYSGIKYVFNIANWENNIYDTITYNCIPNHKYVKKPIYNADDNIYIYSSNEINKMFTDTNISNSMFVSFNNSARLYNYKLKSARASHFPMTIEDFSHNLKKVIKYSIINNKEFMFINAWNEWGENMSIEPSNEHGFKYLEILYDSLIEYNK